MSGGSAEGSATTRRAAAAARGALSSTGVRPIGTFSGLLPVGRTQADDWAPAGWASRRTPSVSRLQVRGDGAPSGSVVAKPHIPLGRERRQPEAAPICSPAVHRVGGPCEKWAPMTTPADCIHPVVTSLSLWLYTGVAGRRHFGQAAYPKRHPYEPTDHPTSHRADGYDLRRPGGAGRGRRQCAMPSFAAADLRL